MPTGGLHTRHARHARPAAAPLIGWAAWHALVAFRAGLTLVKLTQTARPIPRQRYLIEPSLCVYTLLTFLTYSTMMSGGALHLVDCQVNTVNTG